jgi:hypothetical protein
LCYAFANAIFTAAKSSDAPERRDGIQSSVPKLSEEARAVLASSKSVDDLRSSLLNAVLGRAKACGGRGCLSTAHERSDDVDASLPKSDSVEHTCHAFSPAPPSEIKLRADAKEADSIQWTQISSKSAKDGAILVDSSKERSSADKEQKYEGVYAEDAKKADKTDCEDDAATEDEPEEEFEEEELATRSQETKGRQCTDGAKAPPGDAPDLVDRYVRAHDPAVRCHSRLQDVGDVQNDASNRTVCWSLSWPISFEFADDHVYRLGSEDRAITRLMLHRSQVRDQHRSNVKDEHERDRGLEELPGIPECSVYLQHEPWCRWRRLSLLTRCRIRADRRSKQWLGFFNESRCAAAAIPSMTATPSEPESSTTVVSPLSLSPQVMVTRPQAPAYSCTPLSLNFEEDGAGDSHCLAALSSSDITLVFSDVVGDIRPETTATSATTLPAPHIVTSAGAASMEASPHQMEDGSIMTCPDPAESARTDPCGASAIPKQLEQPSERPWEQPWEQVSKQPSERTFEQLQHWSQTLRASDKLPEQNPRKLSEGTEEVALSMAEQMRQKMVNRRRMVERSIVAGGG